MWLGIICLSKEMMSDISYKEFLNKVQEQINSYSPDTLRAIFLEWARNTRPSKRGEFLVNIAKICPPKINKIIEPDDELIEEIRELFKKVENGDLCDGWGWDHELHEERDWGDESWAYEVDEFFSRARDSLPAGHYKLAEKAYELLFDILGMGEESGHLPGNPDSEEMLDTDIDEARACYLRSVYLASAEDQRPIRMEECFQRFSWSVGDGFNLKSVVNALLDSLPNFSKFLVEWVKLLQKKNDRTSSYLLREAVLLSGGVSAIEKFALEHGKRHPKAYLDWINALEKEGKHNLICEAAKKGLDNIPKDYTVRAEVAEKMSYIGKILNDLDMQLTGWREAFFSDPSLSHFLSLITIANKRNCYKSETEAAEKRVIELLGRERISRHIQIELSDNSEAFASKCLLNQIYLLTGKYEKAFELCKDEDSLGWSHGSNVKGLVVSFFLKFLSKYGKDRHTAVLEKTWKEAVSNTCGHHFGEANVTEDFQKEISKSIENSDLPEDEKDKYTKWCIKQTGARVDAIVSNRHRDSYRKAADLLVALVELLNKLNLKQPDSGIIEEYRQKYFRHSAFKKELDVAVKSSNV